MEKQYSLKRIRQHFSAALNDTPFPEYRNIEDCKAEIESWYEYEWDSFNHFLIFYCSHHMAHPIFELVSEEQILFLGMLLAKYCTVCLPTKPVAP